MMAVQLSLTKPPALSVSSPLVGEGQGGGRHTARSLGSSKIRFDQRTFIPGLPPSPALPHKGGGSALRLPQDHRLKAGDTKHAEALL
jgi:hypothetical protein